MDKLILDVKKYRAAARQMAAEGCVLLKNDHKALPLRKGDKTAVFGRCAFHYYKSGLGSGGLVNVSYAVSILDALRACEVIEINEELIRIYEDWIRENPVDEGHGWGTVPWSQKEMPVTEEMVEIAAQSDVSIVIIGRTAGEDQDSSAEEGSYLLTATELEMIEKVSRVCERTVVLLNTGNILDMKWVKEINPAAVLYAWQGGQEGGNGVLDILTGKVNPCGKLMDTIAEDISDYPSTANFGNKDRNYYTEDIYVGYRYFETFAKDKVLYPFGYGLSYTNFDINAELKEVDETSVSVAVRVKNTGMLTGKESVLLYVSAPQGRLGKPEKVLVGFGKTEEIELGETAEFVLKCAKDFASYDDSGVTGERSAFVLEAGEYEIFAGTDVRSAKRCGSWMQGFTVIEKCHRACAPAEVFSRIVCKTDENGARYVEMEEVQPREEPLEKAPKAAENILPYTGDKGYLLKDVYEKNVSLEEFIAQLSDEDLICLFRGEGMCSNRVTPGTASAFGGVTDSLCSYGIPAVCCADGPSGIRMDCGTEAFSLPNGAAIGCSFNPELAEELFAYTGIELRKNKVDTLLGPGINIHRSPLNGRNFEYFSEDPFLTGRLCAAELKGLKKAGVEGTIKHFCCNNQEQYRTLVDSVVSERALREIYLKAYETAVKEGNAASIMSSYNPVNGIWSAGNYELLTVILREEWKYTGIVMTDWWANANWEGEEAVRENRAPMVIAQNDLFMCCPDALLEMDKDNVKEMFDQGIVTREHLVRNAKNILSFILATPAMLHEMGCTPEVLLENGKL